MSKKYGKRSKKSIDHAPAGSRVKIKFSKHVVPPLAGLVVAISVFGFFNSQLISGQIAYYLSQRHAPVSNLDEALTNSPVNKNALSRIIINKINVDAPTVFDQTTVNQAAFSQALHRGVVHYPNTAAPGQEGNVVIFGHSSGQWWAPGDYKFVFTLLNKLTIDDKIFIEYQGVRYTYRVSDSKTVAPTDLSVLNQGSSHTLTLITCTPVGTSAKRLIIIAQQVTPEVTRNTKATTPATSPAGSQGQPLPSADDSFWHNLKQLF